METILLTGAAGFIGFRTADKLLEQGYSVVGVDNMNDYYDVRVKEHRLSLLSGKQDFEFLRMDIESQEDVNTLFDRHEFAGVINLAARAGVRYSLQDPHVYMRTNAMGTLNLLEAMRSHGVPKLVLASTSSLYAGQEMPFMETLAVNTPISPYAASKKAAEVLAYSYHFLYGLDVSVMRYFTVYGPAARPDMSIFRFTKWIDEGKPIELFGDGTQSRDFTYVDDIAQGTIKALKPLGYEIINLGGGRNPVSMNRIIQMLEKLLGKKACVNQRPFHKADLTETWADIEKAGRLLHWKPEIELEEGLERTVRWYRDNLGWVKDVEL